MDATANLMKKAGDQQKHKKKFPYVKTGGFQCQTDKYSV